MKHRCYRKKMIAFLIAASMILSGAVPVYAEEEIWDTSEVQSIENSEETHEDSMDSYIQSLDSGLNADADATGGYIDEITVSGDIVDITYSIEDGVNLHVSANKANAVLGYSGWLKTYAESIETITFESSTLGDIVEIGTGAFAGFTNLRAITIPVTVTNIGEQAFKGCSSLTAINVSTGNPKYKSTRSCLYEKTGDNETKLIAVPGDYSGTLTIPSTVTSIDDYAAYGCSGITGALDLPNNLNTIGDSAFYGCTGITGTLIIPVNVTEIAACAFYGCSSVETVQFGSTVADRKNAIINKIGDSAFVACTSLRKFYLPNTVTNIKNNVFDKDTSLKYVFVYSVDSAKDEDDLKDYFEDLKINNVGFDPIYIPFGKIAVIFDPAGGEISDNSGSYSSDIFVRTLSESTTFEDEGLEWPIPVPQKGSQTFGYWASKATGAEYTQKSKISVELELIAVYKASFSITFVSDDGITLLGDPNYTVPASGYIAGDKVPDYPIKPNAEFLGWKSKVYGGLYSVGTDSSDSGSIENTKNIKKIRIVQDDVFTAVYSKVWTVEFFDADKNSLNFSIEVSDRKPITAAGISLNGIFEMFRTELEAKYPQSSYVFMGWYKSNGTTKWSDRKKVTTDLKLYAQFSQFITITYNYGEVYENYYSITEAEKVDKPAYGAKYSFRVVNDLPGYVFNGWYNKDHTIRYSATITATKNLDLYADWTSKHKVRFYNTQTREEISEPVEVVSGAEITLLQFPSDPESTVPGYVFKGWYTEENGGNEFRPGTKINEDMTIYTHWVQGDYYVRFYVEIEGEYRVIDRMVVVSGDKLGNIGNGVPTQDTLKEVGYIKRGYILTGWNTAIDGSGTVIDNNTVATGDIDAYAQWYDDPNEENYIYYMVSFNSMGGSEVPSQRISENGLITEPSVPTRSQYKFLGWYRDTSYAEQWDFSKDVVTNDMYLYAKWMSWTDEQEAERQDNLNGIYWVKIIKNQEVSIASYFVGAAKLKAEDKKIAKVNSKKRTVKGKKAGSTLITGTFASDAEAKAVRLFVYNQTISQMSAVNTHTSMNAIDHLAYPELLPTTWKSTNAKVASIDPKTGEITVRKRGTTKIIAYYGKIKVTGKLVCGVPQFTRKYIRIVPGQTKKLRIKGVKDYTIVSYNSPSANGRQIAEIDANGMITGINAGESTISANVLGENISCKLFVQQPSLATTKLAMKLDTTKKIKLKHCKLQVVEWQSSNNGVAFVDPTNGTVYAVGKGTATIRTNAGGVTNTIVVTVTEPVKSTKDTTTRKTKK